MARLARIREKKREKSGAKERAASRKLSVCGRRFSGGVNSFKTQTASSDDIERFRDADRDWEPLFSRFFFTFFPKTTKFLIKIPILYVR